MPNVSVVLIEIAGEGPEAKERFVTGLQGLFRVPESKAWQFLATLPATISKSVPEEEGRIIAEKIRSIGGTCRLQPIESPVPAPPPARAESLEEPLEDVEAPAEDVEAPPADSPRIVELRHPGTEGAGEANPETTAAPEPRAEPGPGEVRCPLCGAIQSVANRRCASCFQWLPEPPAREHPRTEEKAPVPRVSTRTPAAAVPVAAPVTAPEAVRRRPPPHRSVVVVSSILLALGAGAVAWFALAFPRMAGRWMLAVAGVDALLAFLIWLRPSGVRPVVLARALAGLAAALWLGLGSGFPFLLQMQVVLGVALLVLGIGRGSFPKSLFAGVLALAALAALALLAGVVGTPASLALAGIERGARHVEEGAFDAGLHEFSEALEIAPASRPDVQAKARAGIATAYMGRNEFGPAIAELEQAVRLDAGNARACFLLAACYIHESRPEDAERMLARVRELDPGHAGLEGLEAIVRQMPR